MIITLKDTTSSQIAARIVAEREAQGATALGRVLTLIVVVPDLIDVDHAIEISDAASREHPCRVLVVVDSTDALSDSTARLDAQVRVGDAAGPSDVIVLNPRGRAAADLDLLVMPLLLSDTPVVAFWPSTPPADPASHPLGRIAARRITDSRETECPMRTLSELAQVYHPGDSDLSWSGITLWRAQLAVVAAEFARAPIGVEVRGHATHPSSFLIAAWLHRELGVAVTRDTDPQAHTITGVVFRFEGGEEVSLERGDGSSVATLSRPGLEPAAVNLPRRRTRDCLMEELRRLDADVYYGKVLTQDLPLLPMPEDDDR